MARVDLQLIDGLGLPYAPVAEAGFADPLLDPVFDIAWQGFVALFPGQTLLPLFDELPVEQLADLVDSVRLVGGEPPDPFVWYTLLADDAEAEAMVSALLALRMVVWAGKRPRMYAAGLVSYGTNPVPAFEQSFHILRAPYGVDAEYAWRVPGGSGAGTRICDIEENGWDLNHEELVTADITKRSVFGQFTPEQLKHGTAVASIIVGADNDLGIVGIVPDASLDLVSSIRQDDEQHVANAIKVAASKLQAGDILLLELAPNFYERPDRPDGTPDNNHPDILTEFDPVVQLQIALAVGRGITVIEAAGNGRVNLDQFPFLAHTRPESPTFSGAIVVGAAWDRRATRGQWKRASSYGSRVDCFAAGAFVHAAWGPAADTYFNFSGTSSASAIIAGAAASLQGMMKAAGRALLAPADIRRLFKSATLGTLSLNAPFDMIGSMPDLRRITKALGLARIIPVAAAHIGGDAVVLVHLDSDNRMVRRHFTFFTGWGQPVPTPTANGSEYEADKNVLTGAQPAVLSHTESDPVPRVVHDAFFNGTRGVHHMWWDSANQAGNVAAEIAPRTSSALGHAVAAVQAEENLFVIAAISPFGKLVVIPRYPQNMWSSLLGEIEIDAIATYTRLSGPSMVSRGPNLVDIVTIDDGGWFLWYTGTITPEAVTIGEPVMDRSPRRFDPGARPALITLGSQLLAAAIGDDGFLRIISIDPAAGTIEPPEVVDSVLYLPRSGPIALGLTAQNVVVMVVDYQNVVRAATRPIAGGAWTPLLPLLSPVAISPFGGVTLVSIDLGVMALAVSSDGVVCSALSMDGILWSWMTPLP